MPATQVAHVLAPAPASIATENLPAGHKSHADAPAEAANLPARHEKQVSTDVALVAPEYVPTGQLLTHVEAPVAPEYLPVSQWRQVVAPGVGEYFPAMHAAQKSGDDAQRVLKDVPAGQSVQTEAPAVSAYLPASHGRQVSKEVAPTVGELVPVLQGVHVAAPAGRAGSNTATIRSRHEQGMCTHSHAPHTRTHVTHVA